MNYDNTVNELYFEIFKRSRKNVTKNRQDIYQYFISNNNMVPDSQIKLMDKILYIENNKK